MECEEDAVGTWNATIFRNDASCDTKDEFFTRYNRGEEPRDIKDDLLSEIDGDDRFNVMFSLAHCMWEVGRFPKTADAFRNSRQRDRKSVV